MNTLDKMAEKDRSKSPIREEILTEGEDDGTSSLPMGSALKNNSDKKNGEVDKKKRIAGAFELFRFATKLDLLFMLLGTVAAVTHGVALILNLVVFGNTLDEFAAFAGSTICGGNTTTNCTTQGDAEDQLIDTINHPIVYQYCLLGVINILTGWIQVMMYQFAATRQVKKIRVAYFRSILKQEIAWFDLNPTGEVNSRLNNDLEKVGAGLGDKLAFIFQALGSFIGGILVGFFYVWQLGLLIVGCAPIVIVVGGIGQKLVAKFTANEQAQYAGAGAVAEEVIGSIRTVIVYGGQEKETSRYAELLKKAKSLGIKKEVISGFGIGINSTILFGIAGLAYWFCGYLITNMSDISTGDVLITFLTILMGAQVLGHASPNLQDFAAARGAAGEIFDTIDRVPEIDSTETDKGLQPERFDSDVTLSNVCFTYPSRPDVQVLDGLSVSVSPGQTLALVGPSGCGKSTVVQLVQRFYDVSEGQVKVGGNDVKDLNLPWLRQHIGVVSQEPVLFGTTIAENIRYGREGVTQKEIEAAAKAANAHSFILELPDKYDTLVGERGTQLSGGQKQRVAIARALVRDPKILLLDEATSALDSESEAQVQAALDQARQGRTTIVVAHRLSTIQGADIIAAFANGKVVEKGSHSQLLQMRGVYYDLVTAQSYGEGGDADDLQLVAGTAVYPCSTTMKNFTRQTSTQDVAIQFQKQVSQQYSKQQSNPDTTKELENKESKENEKELQELAASYSLGAVLWRSFLLNIRELPYTILGIFFSAIIGVMFPLYTVFFGEVLNAYTDAESAEENSRLFAGLVTAVGALIGLASFLRAVFFSISGENLTIRLREESFKQILQQDMTWFDQTKNSTGKLTTRLSHDAAQVQGAVGLRLGLLVDIVVTVVAALIISLYLSWPMTLLILGFLPIVVITQAFQGRVISGVAASTKKGYEESSHIAYEAIVNVRTVASLSLGEKMGNLFEEKIIAPHKKSLYNAAFYGFMSGFSDGLFYFLYAVVFRYGAFAVTVDSDNVAHVDYKDLITVILALVIAGVHSGRISILLPNYSKAILSARRVFLLLDTQPGIDSYSTEGVKPSIVNGELALEKIYFTYPSRPNVPVLQGLSVSVQPGQTLALVGPSGCGKSTVVSLLERLYDPNQGLLKFDGEDLQSLNVKWLRNQIGLVSQEPVLFDATIADNIRYGANFREVSDEEVEAAARTANIHGFISTLPQGYNTNVGAQGTQLSGGQKQRVAIARALIRDPKVLLLDEATSALDTESEKVVQEALDSARKGRTSIVIAHRLSTIQNADHIAVIKDGAVAEVGTHSQLMELKGSYYKLNQAQMLIKH